MEKKNVHIMYGFITGITMVIVGLILYLTGLAFKSGMRYIFLIPFLVGVILNAIAYSKANNGAVTFGNVFGSCFKATMIITLVSVAWTILAAYILPNMKEEILAMIQKTMQEEAAKNGKLTDDNIDMIMNGYRKYWNVISVGYSLIGNLFWGAIFSLIGGVVAKKDVVQPAADNF